MIGGNVGHRLQHLETARKEISQHLGSISNTSAIYETEAWGINDQSDFLNQALIIETSLSPIECLHKIFSIENKMGRVRTIKNAPRIIDIDILFYNQLILNTAELTIPHPEIQNRRFVLIPLDEISPEFNHPQFNKTIHALLLACTDPLQANMIRHN